MLDSFVRYLSSSGMEEFHYQMAVIDQHSPTHNAIYKASE